MDEFNNNEHGAFEEESFSDNNNQAQDPYNMPLNDGNPYRQDPYNMQGDSSNGNNIPQSSVPNTSGTYTPPPQQQSTYDQPDFDPYKQQYSGQYENFGGYSVPMNQMYKTGMATASMVLGIISLIAAVTFMMYVFPPLFVLPIVGIILGAVYKSKHYPVGKGASTAGIVCSSIALAVSLIFLIVAVVLVLTKMPEMLQLIKDYYPEMYEQYYDMYYEDFPQWFENISVLFGLLR